MRQSNQTRRRFLQVGGVVGVTGLAGCGGIIGGDGDNVQDTDGDGVIDSEDYAPRDDEVQAKSDLTGDSNQQECECPQTKTETETPAKKETIIDDFEDGDMDEWDGHESEGREALQVSSDAVRGDYAGKVAFTNHPKVWLTFDPTTASEISFWWKSKAVDDNMLTITLHDFTGQPDPNPPSDAFGFGLGIGVGNQATVNVFEDSMASDETGVTLYDQPQGDTWYKTRFHNIDFENDSVDVSIHDADDTTLGEISGHAFANDISALSLIHIKNAQNHTQADAFIDQIKSIE